MKEIRWGIIGCGDVTEVKSGPAFNKVPHSKLVAVMRRNAAKAEDYARRHGVPKWYADADALIHDPEVNAIYIATPPSSHEEYTLKALAAGKPVYVEKPMAATALEASRMEGAAAQTGIPLTVAHYRRAQPLFLHIRQLLQEKALGDIRFVHLEYSAPENSFDFSNERVQWRVNPAVSGGGIFHDLAPHQLDLMLYFFGPIQQAKGFAVNRSQKYSAPDVVAGQVLFQSGVLFTGSWCFSAPGQEKQDRCTIIGSRGVLSFSVFGAPELHLNIDGKEERILFPTLQHVQQPMIQKVVAYFTRQGANPCTAEEGVAIMQCIEALSEGVSV